ESTAYECGAVHRSVYQASKLVHYTIHLLKSFQSFDASVETNMGDIRLCEVDSWGKWLSKISELRILASECKVYVVIADVAVLSFSLFNDKRTHAYNLQLRAMADQKGVADIPWMP
nr:hypothetical protein [Tanacetum cinerariifolium]